MNFKLIRACFVLPFLGPFALSAGAQVELDWPETPAIPAGDDTVDQAIGAEELRGHVQALSHDSLLGRPMGSDESLVAARYVADRLIAMGALPGVDAGTEEASYFQPIELFALEFEAPSELSITFEDGEVLVLQYGAGFSFNSYSAALKTPELVCVLVEEEEEVPSEADPNVALILATSAGRATKWLRNAGHNRGAGFGLVIVPSTSAKVGKPSTKKNGSVRPQDSARGGIVARVSGEVAGRALAGEFKSVRFDPKATVVKSMDVNVIGLIPGAGTEEDPALGSEVVMLSAHRDHIGLTRDTRPDREPADDVINNGADDDASGCSVVLEIAEALAADRAEGKGPARTVAAVFVTGEESGMVGSGYWARHPTTGPEKVVCALNFEMLGRPDPLTEGPGNIWLTGDERSTLGPLLREHGIPVTPDVRPRQNFFVRSDNVSFARIGIVSQTLSSFGGHGDYHQVSDEWDTLDYDHMEAAAGLCCRVVRDLVSGTWKPEWNEGEPKF